MFVVDGKPMAERARLLYHTNLEHGVETDVALLERETAKAIDVSGIYRMSAAELERAEREYRP